MALKRLGIDYEMWKTSDIDINAVRSYKAIHCGEDNTNYSKGLSKDELVNILYKMSVSSDGKNPMKLEQLQRKGEKWLRETYNNFKATRNLGSIMGIHAEDLEIKDKKKTVMMTYSFPCTDLSLAGLQKGMDRDSGTASSLLWQVERILNECNESNCLPDILCMENVPAVHGSKNIDNWNTWLDFLSKLGYSNYYEDLEAKNYGIPQTRNRCFLISILGNYSYQFPKPIELKYIFEDYLEEKVDNKYYIESEKATKLIDDFVSKKQIKGEQTTISMRGICNHKYEVSGKPIDIAHTLMARDWRGPASYQFNGVIEKCQQ